jgi:hypothetical protein
MYIYSGKVFKIFVDHLLFFMASSVASHILSSLFHGIFSDRLEAGPAVQNDINILKKL